jgi:hypothetical protein
VNVYFVTHPNIDLSAKVTAPSTEKARTVFLDYLERVGKLRRSMRGRLRENMVAEKMRDAFSVDADMELAYGGVGAQGYGEPVSKFDEVLEQVEVPRRNDTVYKEPREWPPRQEPEPMAEPEMGPMPQQEPEQMPLSRIAQVSLGGYV